MSEDVGDNGRHGREIGSLGMLKLSSGILYRSKLNLGPGGGNIGCRGGGDSHRRNRGEGGRGGIAENVE